MDLENFFKEQVEKSGPRYYINVGSERILLGLGKEKALSKLSELVETGKVELVPGESGNPSGTLLKDNPGLQGTHTEAELTVNNTPNPEIEAILGQIRDVDTSHTGTHLSVFIDGVNSKLKNHPKVKACPLVFYWFLKADNINNDNDMTNNEYTVFKKDWAKTFKVTVSRDDTPKDPFFTVSELILCCCKKVDYERRQELLLAKDIIKPKVIQEQRNQMSKDIAATKDIDQALSAYSEDYSSGKASMVESMINNKGMSAIEASKAIDSMDPAKAVNLALDTINKF